MNTLHKKIFKQGSKTYFTSSIFFPKNIKKAVFQLYAFVRIADNFVDDIPANPKGFYSFVKQYKTKNLTDPIIAGLYEVKDAYGITNDEINSFLNAMESDLLSPVCYKTYDDLKKYMYGSAEVIGLMMSKIMSLKKESYPYACKLGEAMQYINFIRDIDEDIKLNRQYIPTQICIQYEIQPIQKPETAIEKHNFISCIQAEIKRYQSIQKKAEHGYYFIPYRYLVPIKTAADMYKWTAHTINKNPLIVFERKVKPSTLRIIITLLKNCIICLRYETRTPSL